MRQAIVSAIIGAVLGLGFYQFADTNHHATKRDQVKVETQAFKRQVCATVPTLCPAP